ncbi:hypothetical protein [Paenibacillus agilis]|uniref:Uncharacterized protein n=1 Tax=Paenibacillus agilis TaxID=3020863 RepID=A0A559IXC8_9BACL|nr:hypothetical protein [Paenibacillus agilis]TVX92256.1 hypothetical protein FPZ44_03775 [Paenibacillus agilis]
MTENQTKVQQTLATLQETYGAEAMKAAAEAMLGRLQATRQLPAEFHKMLSPQSLDQTAYSLDASIDDILAKGLAREAAYGNKGDLLKEKSKLETEIKIVEAQAIMDGLSPDGKTITWKGVKYPFSNDLTRDAFRYNVSQEQRSRLAEVEGELRALEIEALKARDGWETVVQASETARSKAHVQAELLNWLAGGR